MSMSYPQVLKYLNSFVNYEKNINYSYRDAIKLKRVKGFLSLIGNPQDSLRVIHVAGTKGKGSTCAFIAYILRQAGFRTGLYTSPHLHDFRERIRILSPRSYPQCSGRLNVRYIVDKCMVDNSKQSAYPLKSDFEGMIFRKNLSSIVKELKPVINNYNRRSKYGPLTFFEVYTAIAFLYFKRKEVDFAVLETGMGGSLDATNAADSLACAITPISYEHVQKLGRTIKQIARQKAGIIKQKGGIVFSTPQVKEASGVIRNRCKKFKAKLFLTGRQMDVCKNLRLPLLGEHQRINASLAVSLVKGLGASGFSIRQSDIIKGLKNTVWPGRCEVIQKKPFIVLDGAQNAASAEVLRKAVEANFKYQNLIMVLGISDDKDIKGISKELLPLADEVILTRAATLRAMEPPKMARYFKKAHLTQSVKEAKILAGSLATSRDLILVTGSLFVVGEFRSV